MTTFGWLIPAILVAQLRLTPDAGPQTAPSALPAPTQAARKVLDDALASTDPELRQEALTVMGLAKTADAKQTLLEKIKDLDGKVRFAAARGLFYLADRSTADAIMDAFRKEDGWAVKKELARAASAVNARALIPELQTATLAANRELAAAAAWALVDFGEASGKAALDRLGNPPRSNVFKPGSDRWARKVLTGKTEGDAKLAAWTLAQYGAAEDKPVLEKSLTSVDAKIRLWSAGGLLRLSH